VRAPVASAPRLAAPMERPARAATLLGVAAFVAYFAALHALIASGALPALAFVVIVAPWVIAAGAMFANAMRRAPVGRRRVLGAAAIACLAIVVWLAARVGPSLADGAEGVLYAENVAFFVWLGSLFALSLRPGREPLVTQMARKVRRGDMPPSLVRYARGATLAWAGFFAVVVVVSSALFFGASRATWSLFVNVLMWPCIAAMFAGEYAVRLAVLRDVRHDPLWAGIQAFRERGDRR
jgi:uncharacterized membrane protein